MHERKAQPVTAVFCLLFVLLLGTYGNAYAAALAWNTFLGGARDEWGNAIAIDGSNNAYVCGYSVDTWGSPLRAFTETADAFVAKISDNGTLVWNTFLGATGMGSAYGIAVDSSGNVYIHGYSDATWGSPVRAYTGSTDAFVAKLDNNGNLVWNTFLGGSGADYECRLAIDSSGNIYVTGYSDATWGSPVNAYNAGTDAFVAKLDNNGGLTWNTFLGCSAQDIGYGIDVDSSGNVYISGYSYATWGTPQRAFTAGTDGFVAKLTSSGALSWNTFLGGTLNDYADDLTIDNSTNIYVAGYGYDTWGTPIRPFTTVSPAKTDGFVARLASNGSLTWNTFLGGNGSEYLEDIEKDAYGNLFVSGGANASWGSPVLPYTDNEDDAMVAQLTDNGTLVWNAFFGGPDYDDCYGLAVSANGNLYLTGESDSVWGSPVRAYTPDNADIHVTKIFLPPAAQATNVAAASTGVNSSSFTWTRGSGEKCAVFMKQGDNGTASPDNNTTYTANPDLGSGTQIGSTGWYCVYTGTGTSVTVVGLTGETAYRVMVCEYNGTAGKEQYNTSEATGNPEDLTTFCQLNVIPKNLHKLLSFAEPIKAYLLIGSTDTVFERTDMPTYDTTAIRPLLKLRIGQRIVLSMVFVNPFALAAPSEVLVTIGDCMGSIQVKPF